MNRRVEKNKVPVSELTKRILFAIPAAAFFLYITWLGSIYFIALLALLALFIQREFSTITENAGLPTDNYFPYTIGLWILLSPYLPHAMAIGLTIFLLFVTFQLFKVGDRAIKELVSTIFCGVYAPIGLLSLLLVRNLESGFILTLTLLLMIWGNDVFAYFGGKTFGKHLLAPDISPNKTWEGFFFGILGALVGVLIGMYGLPGAHPATFTLMVPAILLVSVFGPLGDLTESRMKRAANVKDASAILPGHGGLFDRFDALILAAPAFYLYLYLLDHFGYVTF